MYTRVTARRAGLPKTANVVQKFGSWGRRR
jgi:hypothetical protein